jgi:DNA (cytosine-5)-methyltransferase 1
VDLFAGCGGLSCGLEEAARRAGRRLDIRLAVDLDPRIAGLFQRNFPHARAIASDVATVFSGAVGDALDLLEARLSRLGPIDFLVGGPPCQGHSNLNNHTRRNDPKNALYLKVARAAEVLQPRVVLVENVPAVQHDVEDVVTQTRKELENLGYTVDARVLDLSTVGTPQRRKRFLILGSRDARVEPTNLLDSIVNDWGDHEPRTVRWAIHDLRDVSGTLIDTASTASADNQARIAHLFEEGIYDLPDEWRPACHRDKVHSYRSVYGRLRWDGPAQTVTTGFGSMGQGRYVHPSRRRTITPHEAARLQGFPDWFDWGSAARGTIATAIGNAVPPLLSLSIGTRVLRSLDDAPS